MELPRPVHPISPIVHSRSPANMMRAVSLRQTVFQFGLVLALIFVSCVLSEIVLSRGISKLPQNATSKSPPADSLPKATKPAGTAASKKPSAQLVDTLGQTRKKSGSDILAQQPLPPGGNTSVTLTLKSDKPNERVYPGQAVRFWLTASPQGVKIPYEFMLDFGDGDSSPIRPSDKTPVMHRFQKEGTHEVSAKMQPLGQTIGTVNQIGSTQATVENSLRLTVEKLPLTVCQGLSLSAKPVIFPHETVQFATQDLNDPEIQYRFVLDENKTSSELTSLPNVMFQYDAPGTYKVHAEVHYSNGRGQIARSDTQPLTIDAPAVSLLSASEPSHPTNVTLKATVEKMFDPRCLTNQTISYKFTFGDGTLSEWGKDTVSYSYQSGRTYDPYVEIGLTDEKSTTSLAQSERIHLDFPDAPTPKAPSTPTPVIMVDPWPDFPIWLIIIAGGGVGGGGLLLPYFVYRLVRKPVQKPSAAAPPAPGPDSGPDAHPAAPHPTIVIHTDERTLNVEPPGISVEVQVRLNSAVASSHTWLTLAETNLIRTVRRFNA